MKSRRSARAEIYALVDQTPATVLLEFADGAGGGPLSRIFTQPLRIIAASSHADLARLFEQVERAIEDGFYAAGYFGYECGEFFEPRAARRGEQRGFRASEPLAWFGIYRDPQVFDSAIDEPCADFPRPGIAGVGNPSAPIDCRFGIGEAEYASRIRQIHEWIRSGDVYQLNFTVPVHIRTDRRPGALYPALRHRQPAPYSAFLHTEPGQHILSLSPELFFRIDRQGSARRITTQPMKGTARRGRTTDEDRAQAQWLAGDPKNRAENVMIVDLLRNDLGRLCEFGSVAASSLFAVERYPTLWQMTSTVSGELRPEVGIQQILRALLPCGSITGAPKVRAMQLIGKLEDSRRGVYTGAIGFFSKEQSIFNVAIRTVSLCGGTGVMGVGSGIVIDSDPAAEWAECQLKAEFLTSCSSRPVFSLVETLLWNGEFPFLDLHLDRLEDSSGYFAYPFGREEARDALRKHAGRLPAGPHKVRLLLDSHGGLAIASEGIADPTGEPLRVRISGRRTDSRDPFLFHKTTYRPVYAGELKAASEAGCDDVVFLNGRGEVTEAALHNIFVEMGGRLLTPPIECGVLPGVLRRHILASDPRAEERVLTADDLHRADAIYLCNAVRGLRRARLAME